ncbi:LOW QUALITY PROTEIN: putative uncharacterized protein C19orf73 homolog [Pteropus medius]|uniref:LOW QUALITY PROTEIN: putative uncharacterized protein C19orf73 homolog n=1 Tax=Pteropus vampyrus TaxID=132908 RepID=UPI00196A58E1|nr:LOW QUALITY PROTEIN: putative uncharacterized protein C19orf73 homolog [Pteropus giganteus]
MSEEMAAGDGGGEAAEYPDHGQLQSRPVSSIAAEPAWTKGRGWLLKPEGWRWAYGGRAAWNASRDPGFRRWRAPALTPHGTGGLRVRRGGSKGRILRWGRPRRRAIGLEGGVNAGSTSAPDSAPLCPLRELHAATPPPPPTQTIVQPSGLPWRTRLMVRSAPPTPRTPTGSRSVSGLRWDQLQKGLGLHPQTLLRVGDVIFRSDSH